MKCVAWVFVSLPTAYATLCYVKYGTWLGHSANVWIMFAVLALIGALYFAWLLPLVNKEIVHAAAQHIGQNMRKEEATVAPVHTFEQDLIQLVKNHALDGETPAHVVAHHLLLSLLAWQTSVLSRDVYFRG